MPGQPAVLQSAGNASRPKVAVVVPVFKQGALLAEALASIAAQQAPFDLVTILVNDGCPFPETHAICRDWALAHGDAVVYLRKRNGGLSSARNAGIEFVLDALPGVEGIYFLDSDNRLMPNALARALAELQRHPDASWIYPNIDMFGLQDAYGYEGNYSLLRHFNENICEAGSLVHRRVFESGVRFDESMKGGYEDWEFWLAAAEKGFRGRCLPEFGFEYRRRPESMVTGSHRDEQAIRAYMKAKHKALLRPASLVREEHRSSPRYAVLLRDRSKFMLFTDPTQDGEERDFAEMERLLWGGISEPARANRPAFLVATTSSCLSLLRKARLAPWVFWHLEERLGDLHVTALDYTSSADQRTLSYQDHGLQGSGGRSSRPAMTMMSWYLVEACAKDSTTQWFDSVFTSNPSLRVAVTELSIPLKTGAAGSERENALEALQWAIRSFHGSRYRAGAARQWAWRNVSETRKQPPALSVRKVTEVDCPSLPRVSTAVKGLDIAFVLPLVSFGGAEKIGIAVAAELRKRGFNPHLVISEHREATLPPPVLEIFDSVSFLNEPMQWNAQERYFGTAVSKWSAFSRERAAQRAIALLSGFDVVINGHSVDMNAVMGELRRRGVKTLSHQHVIDHTPAGGPCGHPYLAVAYEHAYDALICESRWLRDWLNGMGAPYDKLIVVENAPSFSVPEEQCEAALRERTARGNGAPLRCLFIGRFDRQKGMHRVEALYEKINETGLPVEWRVVGGSVLKDQTGLKFPPEVVHPAAWTPERVAEHMQWADVLLLLSSWEGLPLTVLEAMALGTIPICTDVGAIREAVDHGVNGFVVPPDMAVRDAFDALVRLQSDANLRATMASRAYQAGRARSWSAAVEPLVGFLEKVQRS